MKCTLLLLGALLSAASAQAQLGLRAGANVSVLATGSKEGGRVARIGGRAGYQLGLSYAHKLTEHLSVVPEVAYSRLSSRVEVEDYSIADGGYGADYRLGRSYLSVPVLVRVAFGRFYLDAGPQVSWLLSAHEKGTEFIGTIAGGYQQPFDRAATDRYRRFDAGLSAGVGLRLPAGFALDLRSTSGFVSVTSENRPTSGYRGKLRNAVWQASVSYQLKPKAGS